MAAEFEDALTRLACDLFTRDCLYYRGHIKICSIRLGMHYPGWFPFSGRMSCCHVAALDLRVAKVKSQKCGHVASGYLSLKKRLLVKMADLKNRIVQRPIIAHVKLRFFHRLD